MELLGRLVNRCKAGPKALAHAYFPEIAGYCSGEHSLLVRCYMIRGISGAVVGLHIREGELPRHLNEGKCVSE